MLNQKQPQELYDQENLKKVLVSKLEDDKEAYIQFTKQIIIYYLEFIGKEFKFVKVLKNRKSNEVSATESTSHSTIVTIPEAANNSAY